MKLLLKAVFLFFLVVGLNRNVHAFNGPLQDSQGTRNNGMGAANIANTEDSTAIANNPGAMFANTNGMLDMSIGLCNAHPSFQNSLNDTKGENLICALPDFSAMTTPLNGNLKLGVGIFTVGGLASEYRLINPQYGNQVYESSLMYLNAMPAVAYKLGNLSIGLAVGAAYQSMRLKMPYQLHGGPMQGTVLGADMRMEGVGVCGNAGLLYNWHDFVKIGVVYKAPTKIDLSGTADADATAINAGTAKYDVQTTYDWPQSLGGGVSCKLAPTWLIAGDLEWINWSKAMDGMGVDLSNGNSAKLPGAVSDEFPLDWNNQFIYRLGLENKTTSKLTLRCGVTYCNSPIPNNTVIPILCTITEWSGTLGMGYAFTDAVSLDLAYMHAFNHTQDTDISLVGTDYDNSSISLSADTLYMGLSVKL